MGDLSANIAKMNAFKFLTSLHFIGGVLVPFFIDWGNISFTQIMLLQSFFVMCIVVFEVPSGAVADLIGRKKTLVAASIVIVAATLVYSSYPSFPVFMAGECLWALGGALISGADEALMYDTLKKTGKVKESQKIFGRWNSFHMAALMVSAPIGSLIAYLLGLRYTMMLMSLPFFGAFLIAMTLSEPGVRKKTDYGKIIVGGIRYVLSHRTLKLLAFDCISVSALSGFLIWTYQPLLKQLGVPLFWFGFVHAAIALSQILFMNSFPRLEAAFGSRKKYLLLSAVIAGACFILLGMTGFLPASILLMLMIAGFGLSRQVLFQTYMNRYIASHNRATAVSVISMANRLVQAALYPIIGSLVEYSLNLTFAVVGAAIICLSLLSGVEERHLV